MENAEVNRFISAIERDIEKGIEIVATDARRLLSIINSQAEAIAALEAYEGALERLGDARAEAEKARARVERKLVNLPSPPIPF